MGEVVKPPVGFGGNAVMGEGGQGQFLKAMVRAMEAWGTGHVYARAASSPLTTCVSLPFAGGWRRQAFDTILRLPLVRRRSDWLTLLSDEDFDRRMADAMTPLALIDGIMGQCCGTFRRLSRTTTRRVMTSVSTHPVHLQQVLDDERRRVGVRFPSFVHPRMIQRSLEEIEMADAIRVNSIGARQTFLDHGVAPDRVHSISVGVDGTHFRPVARTDDTFRVMVVGWVAPHKGTLYALQAFERAALPNSELVFIGGTGDSWSKGLMRDFMTRLGNVRMTPMDPSNEPLERHYGSASVLLHASLIDGFGLVIPEALSSGCPVIVTRQTGASELIEDGRNGFVVEARDVDAMAERLRQLHADAALHERMCREASDSVAYLTHDWFAAQVHQLYDRVLTHA